MDISAQDIDTLHNYFNFETKDKNDKIGQHAMSPNGDLDIPTAFVDPSVIYDSQAAPKNEEIRHKHEVQKKIVEFEESTGNSKCSLFFDPGDVLPSIEEPDDLPLSTTPPHNTLCKHCSNADNFFRNFKDDDTFSDCPEYFFRGSQTDIFPDDKLLKLKSITIHKPQKQLCAAQNAQEGYNTNKLAYLSHCASPKREQESKKRSSCGLSKSDDSRKRDISYDITAKIKISHEDENAKALDQFTADRFEGDKEAGKEALSELQSWSSPSLSSQLLGTAISPVEQAIFANDQLKNTFLESNLAPMPFSTPTLSSKTGVHASNELANMIDMPPVLDENPAMFYASGSKPFQSVECVLEQQHVPKWPSQPLNKIQYPAEDLGSDMARWISTSAPFPSATISPLPSLSNLDSQQKYSHMNSTVHSPPTKLIKQYNQQKLHHQPWWDPPQVNSRLTSVNLMPHQTAFLEGMTQNAGIERAKLHYREPGTSLDDIPSIPILATQNAHTSESRMLKSQRPMFSDIESGIYCHDLLSSDIMRHLAPNAAYNSNSSTATAHMYPRRYYCLSTLQERYAEPNSPNQLFPSQNSPAIGGKSRKSSQIIQNSSLENLTHQSSFHKKRSTSIRPLRNRRGPTSRYSLRGENVQSQHIGTIESSSTYKQRPTEHSTASASSRKKGGGHDTDIFVNFTPHDHETLMSGVAPSGSSKTKARREKEAIEKSQKVREVAIRAVWEAEAATRGQGVSNIDTDIGWVMSEEQNEVKGLEALVGSKRIEVPRALGMQDSKKMKRDKKKRNFKLAVRM